MFICMNGMEIVLEKLLDIVLFISRFYGKVFFICNLLYFDEI